MSGAGAAAHPETSRSQGDVKGPSKQFFKATRGLVFSDDLTPTEKILIEAIGLHDWGDGRGGFPCNRILIQACGLKDDGPDRGQKAIRRLLSGIRKRDYIEIEPVELSGTNPTGRVIRLLPKALGDATGPPGAQARTPGRTGPDPRAHRPGPPPGAQARLIDPSLSSDAGTDPFVEHRGEEFPLSNDNDGTPTPEPSPRQEAEPGGTEGPTTPEATTPEPPGAIGAALHKVVGRAQERIAPEVKAPTMSDGPPAPVAIRPPIPAAELEARVELVPPDVEPEPETARPVAPALDRAMVDVRQAASMQDEPMMRDGPADYGDLTPGRRRFLDGLGSARLSRFRGMSEGKRREILEPHADGFNEDLFDFQSREIDRASDSMAVAAVPTTTAGLIEAVGEGDVTLVGRMAESLCQDFGTMKDRQLWGAFQSLGRQLYEGEVSAGAVLDAYRQAMNPKSKNRGAVFTAALKRDHGWKP